MTKYKVIRIHVIEAEGKAQAWKWLRDATPEALEQVLDFQTVKEAEEDRGWLPAIRRQVMGN